MKKILSKILCAALVLPMLSACSSPEVKETTAPTQSPEEEAVFKVLMIGQSHAQDSVWLLQEVLKTEMPEKEFLVVDVYQSINLAQHIKNIQDNAAVYDYYENRNGTVNTLKNYTITAALKQEQWDLIIFNEAAWPQTDPKEHTDGDFAWMKKYIKETAAPGYQLAYNATWAQPVSAELYASDRREAPPSFRNQFTEYFSGDRLAHFERISYLIQTYEETDPDFDYVFHGGTAIQYASETHGVPEADPERKYDLYRDYTHLSDFGRLIVAYQIYAQVFGLEELTEVHVDTIPQHLRATAREKAFGDLEITQAHKEAIMASVNYALKNPNKAPEPKVRTLAVLEPIT